MIWLFLKYALIVLSAWLVHREFKTYLGVKRIARQTKSDSAYFPLIGILASALISKKNKDAMRWIKERIQKAAREGKKIVVSNLASSMKPMTMIIDPKMIAEVFTKEGKELVRYDMPNAGGKWFNLGFLYDFSPRGFGLRGAFTEVFKAENLSFIVPKVEEIVRRRLEIVKEKGMEQVKEKGYFDVDMTEVNFYFQFILRENYI